MSGCSFVARRVDGERDGERKRKKKEKEEEKQKMIKKERES